MLLELHIRNFAIIEEANLEFGAGLNVLSGETGAGKTIILSALGLLLGSRASPDMIRAGEKEAVVEGLFELEGEAAMPELAARKSDGGRRELLVRRVIAEGGGRSRVTIDGELATVQSLGKIGASLVQVYGQHEQHSLLRAESHREILDRYANLDDELASYRERFAHAEGIQSRLQELNRRERERADLLELARFRATELERAGLVAGEDEALSQERTVLANASKLASAALEAEQALYGADGAASDTVSRAEARLVEAAALDPKLGDALEMIKSARANLEEAARALAAYASKIEADPARLEEIDNRLQELTRLKRKYGGSLDTAIETLERSRAEIGELEGIGESKAQVEAAMAAALDELAAHANKLSSIRKRAAAELGRKMETELKSLGMRIAGLRASPRRARSGRSRLRAWRRGARSVRHRHRRVSSVAERRPACDAAAANRVGRRALARDARAQAPRGAAPRRCHDDFRRSGRGNRRRSRAGRRPQTETALALSPDSMRHAPGADCGVRGPSSHRRKRRAARFDAQPRDGSRTRRSRRGDRTHARRRSVRQIPPRRARTARARPRMTHA